MTWSSQLADAAEGEPQEDPRETGSPGRGERVPLGIGQHVEVRTKAGELVAVGSIQELAPETGVVRIADRGSGADAHIEVDPARYDIWVRELEVVGDAPTPAERPKLNANPRKPGVHTGGRF